MHRELSTPETLLRPCSVDPHPLEEGLQHVEVTGKPLVRGSQSPDSVLAAPAGFSVDLPKLAFLACEQDRDRD